MFKKFLRICSTILTLVMLVNMLPLNAWAVGSISESSLELSANDTVTSGEQTDIDLSNAWIVEEVTANRTEYSKEFKLNNGLYVAAVYPQAVHYETATGWKEIDNTLKANLDGTYSNTAGTWDVRFPQQLSGSKDITITKDGYTLSFRMAGELRQQPNVSVYAVQSAAPAETFQITVDGTAQTFAVQSAQTAQAQIQAIDLTQAKAEAQYAEFVLDKNASQLLYANVYANTNIRYDLHANRVKESVILASYSSTLRGYRYTLNTGGMIPVLQKDNSIHFYDAKQENVVMTMPAPFLVDANDQYNYDVKVTLTGSGSSYTLIYTLPNAWLASAERAWPVVLDPVINAQTDIMNIRDHTVASNGVYSMYRQVLECGYGPTCHIHHIYLKYRNLPKLTSSDVVVAAYANMLKKNNTANGSVAVEVHKVLGSWESETITWDNKPGHNEIIEDYAIVGDDERWYTWDVTDIVRGWYVGENTGMMFKASNATEAAGGSSWKHFYSSDCLIEGCLPTLNIFFRNNNGLESYWDYTASSAGRAGVGYVNNYTGNLVWIHNDIGFGGNRMPVSISHIYNANDAIVRATDDDNNSNDSAGNYFSMGIGWRTNFNQRVYQWDVDSAYYVWEDSDGTDHYFYENDDGDIVDEDGLGLTLTIEGTTNQTYIIEDRTGNKSYFDNEGRLFKQENNQKTKSTITITYTDATGNKISTITDGAGRVYSFTYSGDLLSRISYKGTGTTEISYVSYGYTGNQLTSITKPEGTQGEKTVFYEYGDNTLLRSAQDIDGYTLTYEYSTVPHPAYQPYRVVKITESQEKADDSIVYAGELTIAYAHNQTTFTDVNGNVQIVQFNNFGNTVSIQDDQGHAQFAQYANNDSTDQDNQAKANQLKVSSKLQNTVGNRLQHNNVENGSDWTAIDSAVTVSRTTEAAYVGNYSAKMVRSASGSESGIYSDWLRIDVGQTYTFSAYVKTGSSPAYLGISDGSKTVTSEVLPANTDWTRLQVSYTNTTQSLQTLTVRLLTKGAGTTYIDCAQMEAATSASRYNLIENGDFRYTTDCWNNNGFYITAMDSTGAYELQVAGVRVAGSPTAQKRLSQTVNISGAKDDTFVFSGWARGDAAPLRDLNDDTKTRQFAVQLIFNYTDGSTSNPFSAQFNPDTSSWQYSAAVAVATQNYSSITVRIAYDYNVNTVYFDGIQLYKEEFGNSYTYDADGNVKSVKDIQGQITSYEYNNNDLTQILKDNKAEMTYEYDAYHNVTKATSKEGIVYEFDYDEDGYGLNTEVSITADGLKITSSATYSPDYNRLVSTTDALGKTTTYSYNADTNMLEWVKYPNDTDATRTEYTYDSMYRLASAAVTTDTGSNLSADYTYENDLLTEIETPSTTYTFAYGDFALRSNIKIGNRTLVSYSYMEEVENGEEDDRKYDLDRLDYGNGSSVEYEYDDLGRVVRVVYDDCDSLTYKYNNDGDLASVTDSATGVTTTYYYDTIGRLLKYVESGSRNRTVQYVYDEKNNLTAVKDSALGTTTYTYDEDNRVDTIITDYVGIGYEYDSLNRISYSDLLCFGDVMLRYTPTYRAPSSTSTSTQLATYQLSGDIYNATFSYTYDDNGNITSISDGTNTVSYVYDSANQLIRENNQKLGKTWTWTYDNAGNILSKREYAYTTGELGTPIDTVTYTYGDSDWGDLLTGYDGKTVRSDEIGNMLSDGIHDYGWENGRQLMYMDSWDFEYDTDGLRTRRYDNDTGMEYLYTYRDGLLVKMLVTGEDLEYDVTFTYDQNGTPVGFVYYITLVEWYSYTDSEGNLKWIDSIDQFGGRSYFVTNAQGDVIALVDEDTTPIGEYTYDAWGAVKSVVSYGGYYDHIMNLNPLRYRGYVYDVETGLYYLQSRYYNPEMGRFINADGVVSGVGGKVLGYNMFAYCFNNPVNLDDSSGNWPNWGKLFNGASLLAVGIMACAAAATVVSGGACAPLLAAACVTFVAGGMTVLNGTAEMIESVTDYNYMRDTVYNGDTEFYEAQKEVFETTAEIGTTALGMTSGSPNLCFVAGTMILISEGAKAIEEIEAGDYVWAWDEETGKVDLKQVVETYINETSELVHVFVNGEEIITTPSHPFYSPVKGWTDAVRLRAGDILLLVNGEYVVVEKVQHEILESPITVYNFQVADYHTYFVSDTGVLVHNSCGNTAAAQRGKATHANWDYGQNNTTFQKEVSIPGAGRADAVDFAFRIIYELKPNNARAIRRGWQQLNRYAAALEDLYGGTWIKILITYD